MQHKLLNRKFQLRFVSEGELNEYAGIPDDSDERINGYCECPYEEDPLILIDASLTDEILLDTLVHELLHFADYEKSEDFIRLVSTDISRILRSLGYRKVFRNPT